jgi:hypothetical protein
MAVFEEDQIPPNCVFDKVVVPLTQTDELPELADSKVVGLRVTVNTKGIPTHCSFIEIGIIVYVMF